MNITTVGIDLAENVFSVHGVDAHGKTVLRKTVSRNKLLELFANLPPCVIGMEACSGAHHWARQLRSLGHDARIIAPRFVIPYRKSGEERPHRLGDAHAGRSVPDHARRSDLNRHDTINQKADNPSAG